MRDLQAECGENMDTWIVSPKPIAVHQPSLPEATKKSLGGDVSLCIPQNVCGKKLTAFAQVYTFFLKAHILAGQVRPNEKSVTDFAWLTKEEIEPRVDQAYWASVKDILSDY